MKRIPLQRPVFCARPPQPLHTRPRALSIMHTASRSLISFPNNSASHQSRPYATHSPRARDDSAPMANASSPTLTSSTATSSHNEHFGVFQNTPIKPFPIRAAVDIGTGGVASLCIARVDAEKGAVQKMLYHTQLPLYLESTSPSSSSSSSVSAPSFALSERTMTDIANKLRILSGAMKRDIFGGISERAAVITWPLCEAENAEELATRLTRELKLDVRVLGHDFTVVWPLTSPQPLKESSVLSQASNAPSSSSSSSSLKEPLVSLSGPSAEAGSGTASRAMKELISSSSRKRRKRGQRASRTRETNTASTSDSTTSSAASRVSPRDQVELLAFLAHASASQCIAPQRMVVISEDAQKGVRLIGTDTSAEVDVADLLASAPSEEERVRILRKASIGEAPVNEKLAHSTRSQPEIVNQHTSTSSSSSSSTFEQASLMCSDSASSLASFGLVEHRLPLDVADAHRLCVVDIQRRPSELYKLHESSPNPLLPGEYATLRDTMESMIAPTLPSWVARKSALGGVIAGTSFNGGLLNIAARVAQKTLISEDHLDVHAMNHFCGLTDVLLATNFPNPFSVLPSAALAGAIMRALHTPRVTYLPELSVAVALVTQPSLWTYDRRATVRARLRDDAFYQSAEHRRFTRPTQRFHRTAAPTASTQLSGSWNELSYSESMKGT